MTPDEAYRIVFESAMAHLENKYWGDVEKNPEATELIQALATLDGLYALWFKHDATLCNIVTVIDGATVTIRRPGYPDVTFDPNTIHKSTIINVAKKEV